MYSKLHSRFILIMIFAVIIPAFILNSCDEEDGYIIVKTNTSVDITGALNYNYAASSEVYQSDDLTKYYIASGVEDGADSYILLITIYFKDGKEKAGNFTFTNSPNTFNGDCATASFKKGGASFYAVSGELKISNIYKSSVFGSFNFKAQNSVDGTYIEAKNGKLEINE